MTCTRIKRTGHLDVKLLCNQLLLVFTLSTKGVQIRKDFDKQEDFVLYFSFYFYVSVILNTCC